jgi:hypothetical protein
VVRLERLIEPYQVLLAVAQTFTAYSTLQAVRQVHQERVLVLKNRSQRCQKFVGDKGFNLADTHLVDFCYAFV